MLDWDFIYIYIHTHTHTHTRDVPKIMSNHFSHANREQQTKESMVVDGTICCVILECLVTSIACITWPVSLLTKWPTTICRFASMLSSNFSLKRKSLLQKLCMGANSVRRWVKHFKDGNKSIQDQPRSGHPRTASTERYKERVDEIIQDVLLLLLLLLLYHKKCDVRGYG